MKSVTFNGVITSITSKVDRSLGLRIATPELSTEEKAAFLDYQGINAVFQLEPLEERAEGAVMVKETRETKTPSQRLRNVIYALHQTKLEHGELIEPDFTRYYEGIIEGFINVTKEKLEAYE